MAMKLHKWADVKARTMSPEKRATMEREVREEVLEMNLAEIRSASGLTQVEMAKRLETVQSSVARLEKSENPNLDTIRRYVHALGGELKIQAVVGGKAVDLIL